VGSASDIEKPFLQHWCYHRATRGGNSELWNDN